MTNCPIPPNIPEPTQRTRRMIALPVAPENTSPVPELTSIHATRPRGPYGDRRYRGNCGGYLIKNLLRYFKPRHVLDPMTGSGTCRDVSRELSIPCHSFDLRTGEDAADACSYANIGPFDFVWLHPPYWKMIRYNDDPRCLSNAATIEEFLSRMQRVIGLCRDVLSESGKIAILIGGYSNQGRYIPLAPLTLQGAIQENLWPACTEIIRLQYGNSSAKKCYRSSFIPGLHDTCMIFQVHRN